MALIKMSSVGITNISGKAGGSVFAHNRGGAYVRNFAVPSNPRTDTQQAARAVFASLSATWRTLSVETQKAWKEAAPSFPVKNPFGDERILSGIALFQQLNRNLTLIARPNLVEPPVPQGAEAVASMDIAVSNVPAGGSASVVITGTSTVVPAVSTRYALYATPPMSAGISSAENRLRFVAQVAPADISGGYDMTAEYMALFGSLPVGSAVIAKVVPINQNTGERGGFIEDRAIVTDSTP